MKVTLTHGLLCVLTAAVVSLGWSQAGHSQAARAWEYKSLNFFVPSSGAQVFTEDGQPRQGAPINRIPELGAQGWELTAMTSSPERSESSSTGTFGYYSVRYTYWLKRPR